jgi:Baseplate J-like protein
MPDCKNMTHPFQTDPGTSQSQRVMDSPLSVPVDIDARKLADLLDFFVQLSAHISYYDEQLQVSDWKPFFSKSLPFTVTEIIKYDYSTASTIISRYKTAFDKKPSVGGLQLLLGYVYNRIIRRINNWHIRLAGSGLNVELALERLIKDKLKKPVTAFIAYANAATHWYCTKNYNFSELANKPVWGFTTADLYIMDESAITNNRGSRKKLLALYSQVAGTATSLLDVIRLMNTSAVLGLEQSFLPLTEELKEKQPPHLALLFSFLNIFQTLQGDLNAFTKKHLDYFYKQVLKLEAKKAVPDQVHVLFEIQKQLKSFAFKKDQLLKDGKDKNKADIFFAPEYEIVINKTQVADQRTLFLNNQTVKRAVDANCKGYAVVEGVYKADDATKADGIDKPFPEELQASHATLGAKWSKYIDPENKFTYPYPNARLGFVLASPVLLLNEGKRTITITLDCLLKDEFCKSLFPETGQQNPCCDPVPPRINEKSNKKNTGYPALFDETLLADAIRAALGNTYYYINRALIAQAAKGGINKDLEKKFSDLLTESRKLCYCPVEEKHFEITIPDTYLLKTDKRYTVGAVAKHNARMYNCTVEHTFDGTFRNSNWQEDQSYTWAPNKQYHFGALIIHGGLFYAAIANHRSGNAFDITQWQEAPFAKKGYDELFSDDERKVLEPFFKPRKALNISFSGEKEWITAKPDELDAATNKFIQYSKITMGNFVAAGNDYLFPINIETILLPDQPAVTFYNAEKLKEDLNTTVPLVKIELDDKIKLEIAGTSCNQADNGCCEKQPNGSIQEVSLYHFFRSVQVQENTKIDVKVCGVKNLLVQNDENVENINSLVHPFGVRPKVGANFYIGSQEIFSKNWQQFWVNALWKDKPANLTDHYQFYDYEPFEDTSTAITEASFRVTHALLEDGEWKTENNLPPPPPLPGSPYKRLFNQPGATTAPCTPSFPVNDAEKDSYHFQRNTALPTGYDFIDTKYTKKEVFGKPLQPLNIASDYGFLRLTLKGVGFQHDRYAFVVARHMMALVNLIDPLAVPEIRKQIDESKLIIDLIIIRINNIRTHTAHIQNQVITGKRRIGPDIDNLLNDLNDMLDNVINLLAGGAGNIGAASTAVGNIITFANDPVNGLIAVMNNIDNELATIDNIMDHDPNVVLFPFIPANYHLYSLATLATQLQTRIDFLKLNLNGNPALKAGLPKEPYTPAIKELFVDYEATADINDINLVHLYPYAGTYKPEILPQHPMLFPTFCDEGNFYIGLTGLVPGSNVNILFQLAEATADSESEREAVTWYYLENNTWKLLRNGFEILDDDTNGLTTSGIIKFALPANMTNENTILPKGTYWIKAGIPKNSVSVSEIINIHTQAIKATFTNNDENDKTRLNVPLEKGSVSKLQTADAAITKIVQPYESFGGAEPEDQGHFYVRVSELLRHKNRAIQKFDYERLTLEAFPKIFKTKCINHSYGLSAHDFSKDFTVAPGYVLIAVIPDLNKLKAAKSFEPKAPVSLLEEIKTYLQKVTSPFVRLKIMNPRYEKINCCLRVKLLQGKDENYYKEKLKQDIAEFLAPWAIGKYDKLTFGQPVNFSDIVRFLEGRDYLDYIIELNMWHADEPAVIATAVNPEILPLTPRSILVAGDIDVCIVQADCPEWEHCGDYVNGQMQEKPCCDHEFFPLNDYCNDVRTESKT